MRTTPPGVYTSVTAAAALLVLRLLGTAGPRPSTAASCESGCIYNNTNRPISKPSNAEREALAILRVNLLLEGLSSRCPTTNSATRNNRPTLVDADTNSGNAEGTANTLVRYNTVERSVTAPVEEFDGQANISDEAPPPPFFVSEHYTPESTCFVSAHGVAYTTIIMSYTHQFNHPTR